MKLRFPSALVLSESEYRAHHVGLNTFFGAVLGFVMAGTERLDALEFAWVLFIVSGVVISILYVSASKQKVIYSLLTLGIIAILPRSIDPLLDAGEHLPDKLQPTLLVWTVLSILIEYAPRRPDDGPKTKT